MIALIKTKHVIWLVFWLLRKPGKKAKSNHFVKSEKQLFIIFVSLSDKRHGSISGSYPSLNSKTVN